MSDDTKPVAPWLAGATAGAAATQPPAATTTAATQQTPPTPAPAAPAVPSTAILAAATAAATPTTDASVVSDTSEVVDDVIVTVPKAFHLRLDNFTVKSFAAGVQRMERSIATHWYALAHGVTIFEDKQ